MSFDIYSNYTEKEYPLWKNIFVISTTTLVIIFGISNFSFLLKHKNKIPFSNISPNLLLITISGNYF